MSSLSSGESDGTFSNGATIGELFAKAAKSSVADSFCDIFALVHSYFLPLPDFLSELRKQLAEGAQQPSPLRDICLINLMKKWLKVNAYVLASDPRQVQTLRDFFGELGQIGTVKKFTATLNSSLEICAKRPASDEWFERLFCSDGDGPGDVSVVSTSESLLTLHAAEALAQQLTLIDHQFLRRITPADLLHRAHSKATASPQLHCFIRRCNETFAWAITEVLKTIQLKQRAALLGRLIELAAQLRALKNFSSAIAVLSALKATPVARLKSTWKNVPRESRALFDELAALLVPDDNHAAYRRLVAAAQPPLIPYMGCLTKDLSAFDEMPTLLPGGERINWSKMAAFGNCLMALRTAQETVYLFQPSEHIVAALAHIVRSNMNEAEQYKLSYMLEQPSGSPSLSDMRSDSSSNLHAAAAAAAAATPSTPGDHLQSSNSSGSISASQSSSTAAATTAAAAAAATTSNQSSVVLTASGSSSSGGSVAARDDSGSESPVVIISHDEVTGSSAALLGELQAATVIPSCSSCSGLEDKYRAAKAELKKTRKEVNALATAEMVTQQLTSALTEGTARLEPIQMTKATALRYMRQKIDLRARIKEQDDDIAAQQKHHADVRALQATATEKLRDVYNVLERSQSITAALSPHSDPAAVDSLDQNIANVLALIQAVQDQLPTSPSSSN